MGMYEMKMENGCGVDKRLGVDEGSQMQVVLGIVIYRLMGSDDAWWFVESALGQANRSKPSKIQHTTQFYSIKFSS